MKKTLYATMIVSVMVLLNACKGPAGDAGPIGPQGAKGNTGAKGDKAELDIIVVGWTPVKKQDHISRYNADDLFTGTGFTDGGLERLSQKILNEGVILAYMRRPGDKTSVMSLPTILDYSTSEPNLQLSYYFSAGIQRMDTFIEVSKPIDPNKYFTDEEYRFVILPGASGFRLKNIDLNNYEAVKAALNLKD